MFQAYISAGSRYNQLLLVKESCLFYSKLYCDVIKHAIKEFEFSEKDTSVSTEIQYIGEQYIKKGHLMVSKSEECMEFGELVLILTQNETAVYFVMDVQTAVYHSEYHLYSVTTQSSTTLCLNINELVDFYPLTSYQVNGQLILLKQSVFSI